MGQALGNVLPLAVAIAIFPVPVIAVVLLLGPERELAKGAAFALAWCLGLTAVGAAMLLVGGAADGSDDGRPAGWLSLLLLALGLLSLAAAVKQLRSRPRAGEQPPTPGWMRTIGEFTTIRAGGAGFALAAVNPKNVLLAVAAGAEIAAEGLPANQQAGVLLCFVLVASVGVLAPVAVAVVLGERSRPLLDGIRRWMERNNAVVTAVLLLLIGVKLIGDAITGFSA
jgi:threonine/homoserine/homoserine lactone efflux protein